MTVSGAEPVQLAAALDGAGGHPAAWHTEPFHASNPVATLDWVSPGRAGVAVKVSACQDEFGHFGRRALPAGPQAVSQLEQLRDTTGADELIVTTITHGHADRVRSYELLAEEWNRRSGIDTSEGGGRECRSRGRQP
jgi:alkanesulfonate monooxygenase SsuD/methylene tetrahydromethanopterin reductase-like flavin-dependent oxidoreductase (luciferase family)